ncbi:MAG: enoyl-CoA hydratase/isomerase family protein [Actinomycetia bacterium]|nr:enoyl-CoA hydratase/isomerase family protein [Actinomycetes bacterium]MCP4962953.1 enoyl-CoA hydratase/isomerase family protein [Actinomycetes bacterium]
MTTDDLVQRADEGSVTTLTLNRPEKLNALTPGVFVALRDHLDDIAADRSVGCVVLVGSGRSFCAGHDLDAIATGERAPSRHFESQTIEVLESLTKPTVARIHGHCYTGGLELALGCDLLVATDTATLGDTHGQWGLVPVWGMSVRLPERVGISMAKELMFTSRRIDGVEAQRIGLVDHCVPEAEIDGFISSLTGEITTNSWGTNRIVKQLLADRQQRTRTDALGHERVRPHGMPEDNAERMRAGGR